MLEPTPALPHRPSPSPGAVVALTGALVLISTWATANAQPSTPPKDEVVTPPAAVVPSTPPAAVELATPPVKPAAGVPREPEPEAAVEGQESELVLRDGRRIAGTLVKKNETSIVFSVGGVPTTFDISTVDRVVAVPSLEERYNALKAAIDPADAPSLLRLAEWLRSRNRCDLALVEVENALAADPGNPDARALKVLVIEQQKVDAASKLARDRNPKEAARDPQPNQAAPKPQKPAEVPFPLLTDEQINIIRVYEVDLNDPPKMVISRDAIERFLTKYAGQRAEGREMIPSNEQGRRIFAMRKPSEILADMFALKAREFYPEVKVLENPAAMRAFRDDVHRTWLINTCATTKCHGGEDAGRLWLYDRKTASDTAAYTNFLILDRFRLPGEDGKLSVPLINYNEPASSPLLQLGLPREEATFKHPEITGSTRAKWRPAFRSTDDERFKQAVAWIKEMYAKRTNYPIDYTPPSPKGAGAGTPAPR